MLKNHKYKYVILGFAVILLSIGCKDTKVNFTMNNQDLPASENVLTETGDSVVMLENIVGDTIFLVDDSDPLDKVKSRIWDVNGDGLPDKEYNDKDFFPIVFSEADEGLQKIRFCINGKENCATKWIFVKPDPFGGELFSVSRLEFLSPIDFSTETKKRNFDLEVQTQDVFSASELSLTINGDESSFDFDEETGILSQTVRLKKGDNSIEVAAADFGSGAETASVEIFYGKQAKPLPKFDPKPKPDPIAKTDLKPDPIAKTDPIIRSDPKPRPDPKPVPKPDPVKKEVLVKITKPVSGYKTTNETEEVRVKSNGLFGKRDLNIQLNGQEVTDFSFDAIDREWVIPVTLIDGKNEVIVTGRNGNGTSTARTSIDFEDSGKAVGGSVGSTGAKSSDVNAGCLKPEAESFSFFVKPTKAVELIAFSVFSDVCGGMEISLSGGGKSEKITVALNQGKTQISIADLGAVFEAGTQYTLSCKTIAGYSCSSTVTPKLADASGCNLSSVTTPDLNINQRGKTVIFDLKYFY